MTSHVKGAGLAATSSSSSLFFELLSDPDDPDDRFGPAVVTEVSRNVKLFIFRVRDTTEVKSLGKRVTEREQRGEAWWSHQAIVWL